MKKMNYTATSLRHYENHVATGIPVLPASKDSSWEGDLLLVEASFVARGSPISNFAPSSAVACGGKEPKHGILVVNIRGFSQISFNLLH